MTRSDDTGQTWLPGVPPPAEFRIADLCIEHLGREFLAALPQDCGPPLPAESDDLALACLLLAHEHGTRSPDRTTLALESCLAAVSTRFWGDQLPWRVALEFCRHNPSWRHSVGELTANLDHHNSSIRYWMLEIAWLVRDRLEPDQAVPKLLNNVADTLLGWEAAAGLCAALHQDEGLFWISADAHKPQNHPEQYRQRLTDVRERGLPAFSAGLERSELLVRRRVDALALTLPARDL